MKESYELDVENHDLKAPEQEAFLNQTMPALHTSANGYITNDEISALGHLPAIDALRGLALCGPLFDHIWPYGPSNIMIGSMGVSVFFVLSGFLITGALLKIQADNGAQLSPNGSQRGRLTNLRWTSYLSRFYMDRFVRLGPSLILMVSVGSWYSYHQDPNRYDDIVRNAFRALFSLNNTPFWGPKKFGGYFPHAWSLACEEQFYLIWSIVLPLVATLRNRGRGIFLAVVMVLSFGSRVYAGDKNAHWLISWNRSLISTALYKMLMGASLRLLPFPRKFACNTTAYIGLFVFLCCPLAAFGVTAVQEKNHVNSLLLDLILCLATMAMIVGTLKNPSRIFTAQIPTLLGRFSYAAYLWTILLVSMFATMFKGYRAVADTAFGMWIAIANTIWIEEPLRRAYRRCRR